MQQGVDNRKHHMYIYALLGGKQTGNSRVQTIYAHLLNEKAASSHLR
jgi:hypothetical protein